MISRTIALAPALVSIIGVLVVRLSSRARAPLLFLASVSPARECQETPLLARRNSSLVRPRIIARVNGSFFSMLRLVHTKLRVNDDFTCASRRDATPLSRSARRNLSRLVPKRRDRIAACRDIRVRANRAVRRYTPRDFLIMTDRQGWKKL